MQQCLFDEIVLFILETVSSEEYLDELSIYRPSKTNWDAFTKRIEKQTAKPGIYPRSAGRSGVHYYAVRKDPTQYGSRLTVANGYPDSGGKSEYWVGLDAQPDHSHGLCQTYALMYYCHEESRLKRGERYYFDNVLIGFQFLLDFINADYSERERCWSPADMHDNMTRVCNAHDTERVDNINTLFKNKKLCLSNLIKLILMPKYRDNLKEWFYND